MRRFAEEALEKALALEDLDAVSARRLRRDGGLGLARVAFEGEMSVAARFDADAVRVRAITRAS